MIMATIYNIDVNPFVSVDEDYYRPYSNFTLKKSKPLFDYTEYLKNYPTGSTSVQQTTDTSSNFFNRNKDNYDVSDTPDGLAQKDSTQTTTQTTTLTSSTLPTYQLSSADAKLTLPELLDLEGIKYRVTSHKRDAAKASKFKSGKNSWHHRSDWAWDIVPAGGVSWDQFKKLIYGNPRIVAWLKTKREVAPGVVRSIGIIDETRPEVLRRTGGTGPHLHVGPDNWAIQMLDEYLASGKYGSVKASLTQQKATAPTLSGNYIKINKSEKTLSLYDKNNNLIKSYPVSTGINPGLKTKGGDGRTPESGNSPFYISAILDSSTWKHDFKDGRGSIPSYGKWFMRLGGVKVGGKTNTSIGIHGSGNNDPYVGLLGSGYKYNSEGCIRMKNADIEDLYRYVGVRTPVYINRRGGILKAQSGMRVPLDDNPFSNKFEPIVSRQSNVLKYIYDNSLVDGVKLGIDHISESGLPVAAPNTPEAAYNFDREKRDYRAPENAGNQGTENTEAPIDQTTTVSSSPNSSIKADAAIPENLLKAMKAKGRKEDAVRRAIRVVQYLVDHGGFTKEQAVAQAGVFLDENKCDPHSYMKAEKAGKGSDFATEGNGNKYGAGIASLTGSTKFHYLEAAGLPNTTKVENMSLEQQCDMIIKAAQHSKYKPYFDILKQCKNLEEATATAFFITSGIAGWQKGRWTSPATMQAARHRSEVVGNANDKKYGYSKYHHGSADRRYDTAKLLLQIIDSISK